MGSTAAGSEQPLAEAVQWLARHGVNVPQPVGADRGPAASDPPGEAEPDADTDDGEADPYAVARAIVLGKLAARAQTRHELDQALRAKKVPAAVAQQVLDRMASVGLVLSLIHI